jgi:phosphonoacetaldehyde hydrolase
MNLKPHQVRQDNELLKDDFIKVILNSPGIRDRYEREHKKALSDSALIDMFKAWQPIQLRMLGAHSSLLPGTVQAVHQLRYDLGCKIGMTTELYRVMVNTVLKEAKQQGFEPDADVAKDEVCNGGRPNPHQLYKNLDMLNISPIVSVVKVDDCVDGISEGLNAGCWTVGMSRWSTHMHIDSLEHEECLNEKQLEDRLEATRVKLRASGAHYVINTIIELPEIVADINARLAKGHIP